MRHPSTPEDNNQAPRNRTRGAIRTHLGRKRSGGRAHSSGSAGMQSYAGLSRHEQEDLFDRLRTRFETLFDAAGERSAGALDRALDAACDALVNAGQFTSENAVRLRNFVRRDVLHRDEPALTFRTGDITTAGTLSCETCGWTIVTTRTSLLPACPQCGETTFRKSE